MNPTKMILDHLSNQIDNYKLEKDGVKSGRIKTDI
jgi:hypothetical protein